MRRPALLLLCLILLSPQAAAIEGFGHREKYCLGELVELWPGEGVVLVNVISPEGSEYETPAIESVLRFLPQSEGTFIVQGFSDGKEMIQESQFIVEECPVQRTEINIAEVVPVPSPSPKTLIERIIQLFTRSNTGKSHVRLEVKNPNANITFYNLSNLKNFEAQISSKLEAVPNSRVQIQGKRAVESFAIDPTDFDFDFAEIRKIASGSQLYKCKDYDFATQSCWGEFVLLQNLTPGEPYTILLTPEDPLYSEVQPDYYIRCYATATTASGASSTATASCYNFSLVRITVPRDAIDGFVQRMQYDVSVTLTLSGGTRLSASHVARLDRDQIQSNSNEQTIGSSSSTTSFSTRWSRFDLPASGAASFSKPNCATWNSGYCDWYVFISSSFTFRGSRVTGTTTMVVDWLNATWNYTKDTTPPKLWLLSPSQGTFRNTQPVSFTYNITDNLGFENCSLFVGGSRVLTNSSVKNNTINSFSYSPGQGNHSWYIRCVDRGGNTNTSATRWLVVDLTKPLISYNPNTPSHNSFLPRSWILVNVSATDTYLKSVLLQWQGSNQSFSSSSGSNYWSNKSGLSDGSYSFRAHANDSAGNWNSTTLRTVTLDTLKPSVTLSSPSGWKKVSSQSFTYTATDTNLNNCSLWGNWSGWHRNATRTPTSGVQDSFGPLTLPQGFFKWNVQCYDKASNNGWAASNYSFVIDTTAPSVLALSPPPSYEWNTSNVVEFSASVSDNFNNISSCTIYIDNTAKDTKTGLGAGGVVNFSLQLINGNYTWRINCSDAATNWNSTPNYALEVHVREDEQGPQIALNSPPNNKHLNSSTVVLLFTPSDSTGIENCTLYLNGAPNGTLYALPKSVQANFTRVLNNGFYYWNISCYDNSTRHNLGHSATRGFTVDTLPPSSFSLLAPTNGTISKTLTPTMQWGQTTESNFANYTLRISDSPTFSHINYSHATTPITNTSRVVSLGANTRWYWRVTAYDLATNSRTTSAYTYTTDTMAPSVTLLSPASGHWSKSGNISFSFNVSENFALSQCLLVLNSKANKTLNNPINKQPNSINLSNMPSGTYSWNINCTDNATNTGTAGTSRILYVDRTPPVVNSFSAVPLLAELGQAVQILVNVTDNFNVSKVIAQIRRPGEGFATNYTMSKKSNQIYNLTYTNTGLRGTYIVHIYANDTLGNRNTPSPNYFYVKAGIAINKIYFDRGETVRITGTGFDAGDNITVDIRNPSNASVTGYPKTLLANSSGAFVHNWVIPLELGGALGNHSITAYDTNSPSQKGSGWAMVVLKPDIALLTDKSRSNADVKAAVNESDSSRASIVTAPGEDFLRMNWNGNSPAGKALQRITFYVQHYESASYNVPVQWLNGSTWVDVCTINFRTTEGFDFCELTSLVRTSAAANNVTIKLTDKNSLGSAVGTWLNTNFAYLLIDWASLSLDKSSYQQGETVVIAGTKWRANQNLTIKVGKPGGSYDSWTVISSSQGTFLQNYSIAYNAALGQYNVSVYYTGNPGDTVTEGFTVTRRPVRVQTNQNYYRKGEVVRINGYGFKPSNKVTLYARHSSGALAPGFPINLTASSSPSGNISYNWSLPTALSFLPGSYNISAIDTSFSNLANSTLIKVVIKPSSAIRMQNSVQSSVLSALNFSDNSYATLSTHTGVEDYFQLNFSGTMPPNYVLEGARLFLEHYESQSFGLVVKVLRQGSWQYACTIPHRTTEGFNNCSLSAIANHVAVANPLVLRITDNNSNLFSNGALWTTLDFAFLELDFFPDTQKPRILNATPHNQEFNFSKPVPISANVSDNVYISRVFANISWNGGSQLLQLQPKSVDWLGNGIYSANFTQTIKLGTYNYSIWVNDSSGNINNTFASRFFIVRGVDLVVNSSSLNFPTEGVEGSLLQLNATIFNTGNRNANGVVVEFWEGNYSNGVRIGNFTTNVPAAGSVPLSLLWQAKLGITNIQVLADPPLHTNGSIFEVNESNNQYSSSILVRAYHIFYGNVNYSVKLAFPNTTLQTWESAPFSGNIYAVDADSTISWGELYPLSRATSGAYRATDFVLLDSALNMSHLPDSINRTYTANGLPKATRSFLVFGKQLEHVPVINKSPEFFTGILWDSKGISTEYDGSQDIVFVANVKPGGTGLLGIYDYELSVPARLRELIKPDMTGTILLYAELE